MSPRLVLRDSETPPRMRRKRLSCYTFEGKARNTSAYAEKTFLPSATTLALWKHLRVRGENSRFPISPFPSPETPPRTRRKLKPTCQPLRDNGNTSAYAEKTQASFISSAFREKHLRVRGENFFTKKKMSINGETPPRTRRKHST